MDAIKDGLITDSSRVKFTSPVVINDSEWVKVAFMIPSGSIDEQLRAKLFICTADNKVTDTSLGGNTTINCKPQFTRYADIRRKGRLANRQPVTVNTRTGNHGQGRFFSKAIDDNRSVLRLSPGVPKFQSLIAFISRAVDLNASILANEGRNKLWYNTGQFGGALLLGIAFPGVFIAMYALKWVNSILSNASLSNYYTIKPMIPTFWSSVNTIINSIAPNIGFVAPETVPTKGNEKNIGVPIKLNPEDMAAMQKLAPNIFTNNNYLDVYAMVNRTNIAISKQQALESKLMSEGTLTKEKLTKYYETAYTPQKPNSIENFFKELQGIEGIKNSFGKKAVEDQEEIVPQSTEDPKTYTEAQSDGTFKRSPLEAVTGYISDAFKYFKASSSHGGHFINVEVEYVGAASDTFSNSFKGIPVKDKFNAVGKGIRDIKFSTAGGNILGDPIKEITDGIQDMAFGALDGLTAGFSNVLQALMEGGQIDMPDMWDESSVSIASHTFKTTLISPYGHPLSSLQALYIPIACLLTFVLPIGTGQSSHTSPYLTSAHLKGTCDIKTGMFKSLTISRGVSNLPYSNDKRPLAFDISFEIYDLDNTINVPIPDSMFAPVKLAFDDSTALSRYINVLTAKDLHSMTYFKSKSLMAYSRLLGVKDSILSPAALGMRAGSSDVLGFLGLILQEDNSAETLRGF